MLSGHLGGVNGVATILERFKRNDNGMSDIQTQHNHEFAIGSTPHRTWLQAIIDSSHIITFCISISVIIYGSFKSLNIDSNNEQNSKGDSKKLDEISDKPDEDSQITQDIDITHALLIPLVASLSLLLMFFFFDSIQTIFLLCTSMLAIVTFNFLFLPVCTMIVKFICSEPETCDKKFSICCFGKFTLPEMLAQFFSLCLVVLWIVTGHWILMDRIGFCVTFIAVVRLPSLKVSTLLLVGLVVYDVFWVYFSQLIFTSNVMIKVASKEADNPFKMMANKLNMNTELSEGSPKLSLPGKLVVPSYQNSGSFSILGLGDIVVPGLLLCFVLRFDAFKRNQLLQALQQTKSDEENEANKTQPHRLTCCCFHCNQSNSSSNTPHETEYRQRSFLFSSLPMTRHLEPIFSNHSSNSYTFSSFLRLKQLSYFHCALTGYFLGLLAATSTSEFFQEAQPALLFLVPFTLVPLLIMAYLKGDLHVMWNEPFHTNSKYFYV